MANNQLTQVDKLAFSINDMMDALDVSRATLYELINAGKIRTYRIGRRRYATREALTEFQREMVDLQSMDPAR